MADLSAWEMIGRLALAAALGAAIGAEREIDGQDAGLRTHLMLALGAALFGLISVGAWDDFAGRTDDTNFRVDVTRVASYVVAGVGFLGGGAILKQAGGVRGLTTAASLWVATAIGLAAGVGFWVPAVAATVTGLLSLAALRPVRAVVRRVGHEQSGTLLVVLRDASAFAEVARVLYEELGATPAQVTAGPDPNGRGFEIVVEYARGDRTTITQHAAALAGRPDVAEVHVGRL